jgi:hypothetical protein
MHPIRQQALSLARPDRNISGLQAAQDAKKGPLAAALM